MKVAVVGSRTWTDTNFLYVTLHCLNREYTFHEIISGGATGVDTYAVKWAKSRGIPTKVFKPDWSQGKMAGAMRNREIVDHADMVVAFWDGVSKGTKITIDLALSKKKTLIVYFPHEEKSDGLL